MARETSAQRAASIVQVTDTVANDPPEVKKAALQRLFRNRGLLQRILRG